MRRKQTWIDNLKHTRKKKTQSGNRWRPVPHWIFSAARSQLLQTVIYILQTWTRERAVSWHVPFFPLLVGCSRRNIPVLSVPLASLHLKRRQRRPGRGGRMTP